MRLFQGELPFSKLHKLQPPVQTRNKLEGALCGIWSLVKFLSVQDRIMWLEQNFICRFYSMCHRITKEANHFLNLISSASEWKRVTCHLCFSSWNNPRYLSIPWWKPHHRNPVSQWDNDKYRLCYKPSPGDLPNPGTEPRTPALQADSLPVEPQRKPKKHLRLCNPWNLNLQHIVRSAWNYSFGKLILLFSQMLLFPRLPSEPAALRNVPVP